MHAVTLDLWRTLIDESPDPGTGGRRLESRIDGLVRTLAGAGLAFGRSRIEQAMKRSRESFDRDHDRGNDLTFEGRVRELIDFIEPGLAGRLTGRVLAEAIEAVDAPFHAHPPVPLPGAGRVIEDLGRMGVVLGLITNTGFTSAGLYRSWLSGLGWLKWLQVTTFSNEAAMAKPTPAIFHRTLAALSVDPQHALHVGDSPHHDVAGAKRVGMSAAWLNRGAVAAAARDGMGAKPDFVLKDLQELPAVVARWLAG